MRGCLQTQRWSTSCNGTLAARACRKHIPLAVGRFNRFDACRRSVPGARRCAATSSSGNGAQGQGPGIVQSLQPEEAVDRVNRGVVDEDDISPLRAALELARERHEEAIQIREALEAEAQAVAQAAVQAEEAMEEAAARVLEAQNEAQEVEKEEKSLRDTIALLESDLAALEAKSFSPTATVDIPVFPSEGSAAAAAAADRVVDLSAAAGSESAPAKPSRIQLLMVEIASKKTALDSTQARIAELQAKLEALDARKLEAERQYAAADEVASAAMKKAEAAVRDELEAATITDQVENALKMAEEQLRALSPTPAEAVADTLDVHAAHRDEDIMLSMDEPLRPLTGPKEPVESLSSEDKSKSTAAAAAVTDAKKQPGDAIGAFVSQHRMKILAAAVVIGFAVFAANNATVSAAISARIDAFGVYVAKLQSLFQALLAKIPIEVHKGEEGLFETLALLLTSVIAVPLVCRFLPGGSPVLGFLIGGAVIGPHGMAVIKDVEAIRHLAEMGVVLLLFNIGLELSLERLQQLAKYVFGLGSMQFVITLAAIAACATAVSGVSGPGAIIMGGALALSSTAVAMQVLQDRGESGARHGRATFSVLLLQDLAVVVLLMLVPLLAPNPGSEGGLGFATLARALGIAGLKAVLCIVSIILGGRGILRPLYRRISQFQNAEIFAALTLLVVLGTSVITQLAGLSLALGAFLAGLLLAETEFALQVESDIAPFKGLLMGLFFMSVGMEISAPLLLREWRVIALALSVLIVGKVAIMAAIGPLFGLSRLSSVRSGLYLAPGGEFAFVTLGDAVARNVLPAHLCNVLFIVVVLSMALTPYLAQLGSTLGKLFESKDMRALQPSQSETKELNNHVIICGFGRVGQVIAQLLSEHLIPFVALDVRSDRVAAGKAADLPVYFGDAGSPAVLHSVGADRASCAVITLDTPGANYRTVWAMNKHYPDVNIFVRAHDVDHGVNLEKAGATVVVPETLEPSLQLAAAVMGSMNYSRNEVVDIIDDFRSSHLAELQQLSSISGSSLGYGFRFSKEEASDAAAAANKSDAQKADQSKSDAAVSHDSGSGKDGGSAMETAAVA